MTLGHLRAAISGAPAVCLRLGDRPRSPDGLWTALDGVIKSTATRCAIDVAGNAVLFPFGQLLATRGALEALRRNPAVGVWTYLSRHITGDWGDLDAEGRAENELSLSEDFRLLSAYALPDGTRICLITEADHSVTTLLLPDEY